VVDSSGARVEAEKQKDNSIIFEYFQGSDFYKIYSCEEFKEKKISIGGHDTNPVVLLSNGYVLGASRDYEVVSNKSMLNFFDRYGSDYEKLKQDIGIKNDFNIAIRDSSGEIKKERYKPRGIEIKAREIPIEILNEDGKLEYATMNLQVWS